MNFVYLSPHFPPNYRNFSRQLHRLGVTVLGLADEPYYNLSEDIKTYLREYYRVNNMHNYDELLRALGYFTHRHGKLDRLESLNEYWLETEARLRTDFNIPGINQQTIPWIKRKSLMKQRYIQAGIQVARGKIVNTLEEAQELIAEFGYPVVTKPDIGVGAVKTFKIHDEKELKAFFEQKPPIDYILEEFITGQIISFDGLTDQNGKLVFYTSHVFSLGIMETVNQDDLLYYYSLRDIPADLEDAGKRVLAAFDVRERFFHFEFFRTPEGKLVALEVNMRPPGGLTTDMFNYANDIDIYEQWAQVVVNNRFTATYTRPYYCCYVGRKHNRAYQIGHDELLHHYTRQICHHEPISGVFSAALGDYGYLVRSPELDEVLQVTHAIQTQAG
jgi:biotin carboxylase